MEMRFFSYPIGNSLDYNPDKIDRWTHIEFCFNKHGFKGIEANAILYLIDENSANINSKNFQSKVNSETDMDSKSPTFLSDSNFYRKRSDGIWEYNLISRIRLQELNKNVILATELGIDNIKMDGEINNLMLKKTMSAFSKDIHCGSDALVRIEQQKGFPDLGELFVNKILDLDDILKLRENWNGKLFRYWAKLTDYEENLMRKDVLNSVNNVIGSKLLQPLRLLGTNLIGIAGFLPGIAASTFDSYVLDNVLKGWHPNFFLDNKLKALIDDCVKRDNDKRKVKLLSERFKGVRPNDPCPCGSGKKFKKCHGRLL
ncbi:MAG: SEC-C domain-containing protein [Prevotella nigrescens]|uniref:SEC-C domain-containing protein n=1 Tax=Prevotella nigrescens TaxID=28133 RepID=A0A9D6ABF7_9BACT|nr:SEC-C domain-containing protein [Prevotella nigrescens]